MRALRYLAALVVVLGLVALTAWLLSWPFAKAVTLAPVIVVGGAALVGLILLWGKVALSQLRESSHPRRVLAYWLLGLALLVVLTVLGVKLPREGG
jgi:nitrate reductase gamma subunit